MRYTPQSSEFSHVQEVFPITFSPASSPYVNLPSGSFDIPESLLVLNLTPEYRFSRKFPLGVERYFPIEEFFRGDVLWFCRGFLLSSSSPSGTYNSKPCLVYCRNNAKSYVPIYRVMWSKLPVCGWTSSFVNPSGVVIPPGVTLKKDAPAFSTCPQGERFQHTNIPPPAKLRRLRHIEGCTHMIMIQRWMSADIKSDGELLLLTWTFHVLNVSKQSQYTSNSTRRSWPSR